MWPSTGRFRTHRDQRSLTGWDCDVRMPSMTEVEAFAVLVGLRFTLGGELPFADEFIVTDYDESHFIIHRCGRDGGEWGKLHKDADRYSGWRMEVWSFVEMWDMGDWLMVKTGKSCSCGYHDITDDDDYLCKWCRYNEQVSAMRSLAVG